VLTSRGSGLFQVDGTEGLKPFGPNGSRVSRRNLVGVREEWTAEEVSRSSSRRNGGGRRRRGNISIGLAITLTLITVAVRRFNLSPLL